MADTRHILYIIPRRAVQSKYGRVPKKLFVDITKWKEYYDAITKSGNADLKPSWDDALTHKWWEGIEINLDEIRNELGAMMDKDDILDLWMVNDDRGKNDVYLETDDNRGLIRASFAFDVADDYNIILREVIDIFRHYDILLMDEKGNVMEPVVSEVIMGLFK